MSGVEFRVRGGVLRGESFLAASLRTNACVSVGFVDVHAREPWRGFLHALKDRGKNASTCTPGDRSRALAP